MRYKMIDYDQAKHEADQERFAFDAGYHDGQDDALSARPKKYKNGHFDDAYLTGYRNGYDAALGSDGKREKSSEPAWLHYLEVQERRTDPGAWA